MSDTLADIRELCVIHEVGSRVTCNPPPTDTDRDVLCVVHSQRLFVFAALGRGFEPCGYVPPGADVTDVDGLAFVAMRRGDDNLIITDKPWFATKFLIATQLAAKLNLLRKEDRVTLFQWVLYGNL